MELEFCLICGSENTVRKEACADCGGRKFVFGKNFSYVKGEPVKCDCGSDSFELTMHINRSPVHDYTYKCFRCRNVIGVQNHVNYLDAWDYCDWGGEESG